jgi:putative DNA primase/helicase
MNHVASSSLPFQAHSLEDFLGLELAPARALLAPWLPRRGLVLMHGPRGIGKSHLALAIAHAVSTGGGLFDWLAPEAARVVLLDGEMPVAVLRERCAALAPRPAPGMLRLLSMDLQRSPLNLAHPEDQARLAPLLEGADLVVVDNLSTLARHGLENAGESWEPVQDWAIAQRRAGRAVLFVHHSARNGSQRGTSRREDIMDTILALRPAEAERGACFAVHVEKARDLAADFLAFRARLGPAGWQREDAADPDLPRVVTLSREGYSIRQIAAQLELGKNVVHRLRRRARVLGMLPELDISYIVRTVPPVPEGACMDPGQMSDVELDAAIALAWEREGLGRSLSSGSAPWHGPDDEDEEDPT